MVIIFGSFNAELYLELFCDLQQIFLTGSFYGDMVMLWVSQVREPESLTAALTWPSSRPSDEFDARCYL
jgi:hypothetical protein